jgi:aryl-alcohol dehydrogenase-like predicted oxidoreductase
MKLKPLGRTGFLVSELCPGTMTFGGGSEGTLRRDRPAAAAEANALVGAVVDADVNFLDTADVYAAGRSVQITGQALRNLEIARDDVVIATPMHC